MSKYSSTEILTAFKNLCRSRGYIQKVVGDYCWEEPRKRKIGNSCKLWKTEEQGTIMEIYDTKVKQREKISTGLWL